MHKVEPSVKLVAKTTVDEAVVQEYLKEIGALTFSSEAQSSIEELVELSGRACYKSFEPGLNPNVTRTRKGNEKYIKHILESGHGSVLEHGWVTFIFQNVSRVFTHELVRHRVGVAISQESLRFVRVEDLGLWTPPCFSNMPQVQRIMEEAFKAVERYYIEAKEWIDSYTGKPFDSLSFDITNLTSSKSISIIFS